jgi:amidase/aspartyl-tRNA(Asn)/glutamyl-tRNA(Gln) amidotransferase subunit A
MDADDPCTLPIRTLASALRRGELSSEEVTRAFLDRIETVNPKLNAVVYLRARRAVAQPTSCLTTAPRRARRCSDDY